MSSLSRKPLFLKKCPLCRQTPFHSKMILWQKYGRWDGKSSMSPLPDLTLPTSHPNLSILKGNKRLNQGLKAYENSNDVDISNLNTGQPCHLLTALQIFTCQLRVSRTYPDIFSLFHLIIIQVIWFLREELYQGPGRWEGLITSEVEPPDLFLLLFF